MGHHENRFQSFLNLEHMSTLILMGMLQAILPNMVCGDYMHGCHYQIRASEQKTSFTF